TPEERAKARQLRREAEDQLDLLTETERVFEADFYSYRYFASEGFLPGYSFPRLPLSAFIPGRVAKTKNSEFLSRPRFLAISEFGPRAIVYHEGSRYRINRVIMQVEGEQNEPVTGAAKQCSRCGYMHPMTGNGGADLCERCGTALPAPIAPLFRLQNVSTKRADKISSDEEERLRIGYEVQTGVRFSEQDGRRSCKTAKVLVAGETALSLAYGHAATLWRVNRGWRRRAQKEQLGFFLDIERGYWASNPRDEDDAADDTSKRIKRVIPYVEDRRNCILVEPVETLEPAVMASLQAALKNAIQVEFQLEESELAGEPLPSRDSRNVILLYEAAEGGAGVLRRLVDDLAAVPRIARRALDLCHFDPDTGADLRKAPRARDECEAACYDCLMSYSNQQDHELLDRMKLRDLLLSLRDAKLESSPGPLSRAEHFAELDRFCQSELERRWLREIETAGLRLPSRAQTLIEVCKCRPDFLYEESQTVIYVDGPHHEYPERRSRDTAQTTCLEDRGYTVLRFVDPTGWGEILAGHPGVFGKRK
ncbi:MAG: Zn-binding domain-containing protein, partial [Candidatus Binatia bacterium]